MEMNWKIMRETAKSPPKNMKGRSPDSEYDYEIKQTYLDKFKLIQESHVKLPRFQGSIARNKLHPEILATSIDLAAKAGSRWTLHYHQVFGHRIVHNQRKTFNFLCSSSFSQADHAHIHHLSINAGHKPIIDCENHLSLMRIYMTDVHNSSFMVNENWNLSAVLATKQA